MKQTNSSDTSDYRFNFKMPSVIFQHKLRALQPILDLIPNSESRIKSFFKENQKIDWGGIRRNCESDSEEYLIQWMRFIWEGCSTLTPTVLGTTWPIENEHRKAVLMALAREAYLDHYVDL